MIKGLLSFIFVILGVVAGVNAANVSLEWDAPVGQVPDGYKIYYTAVNPAPTAPVVDIVMDNPDAAFTGSWSVSTLRPGFFGTDYAWTNAGSGITATYDPVLPHQGEYEIFAWWSAWTDRAVDVPYNIQAADGQHMVNVDQSINGGQWNSLGKFELEDTLSHVMIEGEGTGSYVLADGIRFVATGFRDHLHWETMIDVGNVTSFLITDVPTGTYTFTVTAYYQGAESEGAAPVQIIVETPVLPDPLPGAPMIKEYKVIVTFN